MSVEDFTDLPGAKEQVKALKDLCEVGGVDCKIGVSMRISSPHLRLDINTAIKAVMIYYTSNPKDPHGILDYLEENGYTFYNP